MLLCVGGMVIVGSSVSISQLIVDYPHLTGQAARYTLAAAALFAIARAFPRFLAGEAPPGSRPNRREWVILTVLAATGLAAFNACVLIALPHADPAVVGTFIGAAPLGLALLGPLWRGHRPSTRLVVAAGTVVLGTALVQGSGRADLVGVLASVGALGGEIAFSLLAAAVLPRLGPVRVSAYSCALAVPLLLAAAVPAGEFTRLRPPTMIEAATIGYLAAMMTVIAFLSWFTGLRRLGVARAGVLVGVMPVATLATAAVQAGTLPHPGQTGGVLVVGLGLTLGLKERAPSYRYSRRTRSFRRQPERAECGGESGRGGEVAEIVPSLTQVELAPGPSKVDGDGLPGVPPGEPPDQRYGVVEGAGHGGLRNRDGSMRIGGYGAGDREVEIVEAVPDGRLRSAPGGRVGGGHRCLRRDDGDVPALAMDEPGVVVVGAVVGHGHGDGQVQAEDQPDHIGHRRYVESGRGQQQPATGLAGTGPGDVPG